MANIDIPFYIDRSAVFFLADLIRKARHVCAQMKKQQSKKKKKQPKPPRVHVVSEVSLSGNNCFMNVLRLLSSYTRWESAGKWEQGVWYRCKNRKSRGLGGSSDVVVLHSTGRVSTDSCTERGVVISVEQDIPPGSMTCVLPDEIEIGFSRSFELARWTYRVRKAWKAPTLVEAQAKMTDSETSATSCCYSVQIRMRDTDAYMAPNSNAFVACSVLLKVSSLFGHQAQISLTEA